MKPLTPSPNLTQLLAAALCLGAMFLSVTACSRASQPAEVAETPLAEEGPLPSVERQDMKGPILVNDRETFNGVWELVSFEQNEADGNISHPYGEMAVGRLTFDRAGRMSVFVMKPGRVASVNTTSAIATASTADLRQIADGFMAYYGDFRLDENTKELITKVEGCTIPAWSNTEQKRTYELSDDGMLTLITPATRLTWRKLPD